jgi:hypothetical protein
MSVVHTSRIRIEKHAGPHRTAHVESFEEPINFGIQGGRSFWEGHSLHPHRLSHDEAQELRPVDHAGRLFHLPCTSKPRFRTYTQMLASCMMGPVPSVLQAVNGGNHVSK